MKTLTSNITNLLGTGYNRKFIGNKKLLNKKLAATTNTIIHASLRITSKAVLAGLIITTLNLFT